MAKFICYTDGSAKVTYPRLGGFGVYIKSKKSCFKIRKGFSLTKTGRMELMAVIYCLRSITDKNSIVVIYSDSMYTVKSANDWAENWERNNWGSITNVDLMKKLLYELRLFKRKPVLNHIKGHQKVTDVHTEGNNIADFLANYKTQKSWERDLPFEEFDLNEIEKGDFIEINGKIFYNAL